MRRTKPIIVILAVVLAGFGIYQLTATKNSATNDISNSQKGQNDHQNDDKTALNFDKTRYSQTDPTSIWVIVNKKHSLSPKTYIPSDLVVPDVRVRVPGNSSMQVRQVTAKALEELITDAKAQGINLELSSGYRSYSFQVSLYGSYVNSDGQAAADRVSARPGYSEHQTGLAADLDDLTHKCHLETCFGDLPEGKWLAAHAYEYGFVIRYPKDKESVTGYAYEPWHLRYVGIPAATEMHSQRVETLEEFFGVSGGVNY